MSTFFRALEQAQQDRARLHPTALSEPATERSPAFSPESRRWLDQLELLFEYAKFDIGLYITVGMIFVAALAFEPAVFKFHRGFLSLAVGFIGLAGMAAGIIASRCAHFTSPRELWAAKFGPFRRSEEHTSELQSLAYLVCRLLLEKKNDDNGPAVSRGTHPQRN